MQIPCKNGFADQQQAQFGNKKRQYEQSIYFILNWMDVHSSPIVKFWTWQRWRIYISKTIFPTAVYYG